MEYKKYKEDYIKQIADEEYSVGNITKKCYEAMMNYKVKTMQIIYFCCHLSL